MSILQVVHRPIMLQGIHSMTSRRFRIAASLISFTSVTMIAVGVTSLQTATPAWWVLMAAAVIGPGSLFWLWPRLRDHDPEIVALRAKLTFEQKQRFAQQKEFDRVRLALQTELQFRAERLAERERDLASRFARFHEFLEYPLENVHAQKSSGQLQKLSEQDRSVRQLLDAEAERVYEKIRRNGYTVNHKVDMTAIREETLQLIQRVAKIYNPHSQNPLLETSFDQLARAASRICLRVLVLLEQLPVGVQHYNANKLYGYMLKLNHERYAEEVAQGLHKKERAASGAGRGKKKIVVASDTTADSAPKPKRRATEKTPKSKPSDAQSVAEERTLFNMEDNE